MTVNKAFSFRVIKFKSSLKYCEGDPKISSHALSLDMYEALRNPGRKLYIEQRVGRKLLFF